MTKLDPKSTKRILGIAATAVAVVLGVFLCTIYINNQPDPKTKIDNIYYGSSDLIVLDTPEFRKLVDQKQSFLLITYQPGCTASILSFARQFSEEHNIAFNYLVWSELRETEVHEDVKFTPSVMVFREGKVVKFLRADSNEDVNMYNNYADFKNWLENSLDLTGVE